MEFGICAGWDNAALLASAGYDFLELNVQGHLVPQEAEEIFAPKLAAILASPLPCKVANCFVPGALKITGPEVDMAALQAYVGTACRRAARAGLETIVFGSGGARQIPEGFSREEAWEQLVAFGKMVAPIAGAAAVTVVVEPLNRSECNVLTTVGESAELVRAVGHPAWRLLVDAYHWGKDGDSFEDLVASGPLLGHVHIATYAKRVPPGFEVCDFSAFFAALHQAGYNGRISIESKWDNLAEQAGPALAELRRCATT